MDQGYTHPDRLLAVLSRRQMTEIEIYAGIEPIGGMISVSRPEDRSPDERTEEEELAMFDQIKSMLGGGR